jgi:hypothetical protein
VDILTDEAARVGSYVTIGAGIGLPTGADTSSTTGTASYESKSMSWGSGLARAIPASANEKAVKAFMMRSVKIFEKMIFR